jgi:hypothetical protein
MDMQFYSIQLQGFAFTELLLLWDSVACKDVKTGLSSTCSKIQLASSGI